MNWYHATAYVAHYYMARIWCWIENSLFSFSCIPLILSYHVATPTTLLLFLLLSSTCLSLSSRMGEKAFSVLAPRLWTSFRHWDVRSSSNVSPYKCSRKTHFYYIASHSNKKNHTPSFPFFSSPSFFLIIPSGKRAFWEGLRPWIALYKSRNVMSLNSKIICTKIANFPLAVWWKEGANLFVVYSTSN